LGQQNEEKRTCKVVALSSPALSEGIKRCLSVTPEREEGEMRSDTIHGKIKNTEKK